VKLAVARVGKRPKDDASVFIDGTPKIHGEGENNDKEEEIDAKQRMQQPTQSFWREHVEVHPDEGDDGENAKHDNDDSREAFRPVCGRKGLLDEGDFGVSYFRSWAVGIRDSYWFPFESEVFVKCRDSVMET
jgi:hypothetical protein